MFILSIKMLHGANHKQILDKKIEKKSLSSVNFNAHARKNY